MLIEVQKAAGSRGGKQTWNKLGPIQRKRKARMMAKARWDKARALKQSQASAPITTPETSAA